MLAAAAYMIVFRIVHILAGIFWAGSVYLFVVFIQPSVAAIAPAGAPFMAELLGKRKLVDVLIGLGSTTVIGGLFLYWHDWHLYGSFGKWVSSRFGADLTVEYPTGSGRKLTLDAVADDLWARLVSIFLAGPDGRRPCFGGVDKLQHDRNWKDNLMFSEYFHGDNAAGLGATHQTGWTGLVADVVRRRHGAVPSIDDIIRALSGPGRKP